MPLEVVEDLELECSHDVIRLRLDAIPDHLIRVFEYSSFFRGKRFEILRLPDEWSNASWVIRHCAEGLEVEVNERIWAAGAKQDAAVRALRLWQSISSCNDLQIRSQGLNDRQRDLLGCRLGIARAAND